MTLGVNCGRPIALSLLGSRSPGRWHHAEPTVQSRHSRRLGTNRAYLYNLLFKPKNLPRQLPGAPPAMLNRLEYPYIHWLHARY